MYKHTQEKEEEKYVNLKQLAHVSELTSLRFGLLVFLPLEGGQGRRFCQFGLGKEQAQNEKSRGVFSPFIEVQHHTTGANANRKIIKEHNERLAHWDRGTGFSY